MKEMCCLVVLAACSSGGEAPKPFSHASPAFAISAFLVSDGQLVECDAHGKSGVIAACKSLRVK